MRACYQLNAGLQAQDAEVRRLLSKDEFNTGERVNGVAVGAPGNAVSMETLSRFSMVKSRIY